MEILKISENELQDSHLAQIAAVLKSGGVIAHASDTCYGFMSDVFQEEAVKKVHDIKGSPHQKPMSIFLSSISQVYEFAEVTKEADEFLHQNLPGPYTVVLRKLPHFEYQNFNSTIGIRVPVHTFVRRLVDYYGGPLTTTSANLTGNPQLYSGQAVHTEFSGRKYQPDLIVDFGQIPRRKASRIIDYSTAQPRWLR